MTVSIHTIGRMGNGGTDVLSVDLTDTLDSDETVSSLDTPTSSSGVALSSEAVKSSSWTYKDGTTVAANKGVQCNVVASSVGTYTVSWSVTTSASRVLKFDTTLVVE